DGPPDWPVPGDFIIPLHGIVNGKDGWRAEVVPLPPSPGSPHGPRIYPVTPGTLQEMRAIPIGLP
ncbi:MAG TPA: hypothetical protein VKE94_13750, partial [Gemmataceae bacterium]|nr:hypothetical protein [Gemmataceae bacterium]